MTEGMPLAKKYAYTLARMQAHNMVYVASLRHHRARQNQLTNELNARLESVRIED